MGDIFHLEPQDSKHTFTLSELTYYSKHFNIVTEFKHRQYILIVTDSENTIIDREVVNGSGIDAERILEALKTKWIFDLDKKL